MNRSIHRRGRLAAAALAAVIAVLTLALGGAGAGAHGPHTHDRAAKLDGEDRYLLAAARKATLRYRTPQAAEKAGYAMTPECVADPRLGGMGFHAVNEKLMADGELDARRPEILVYAKDKHRNLRLVALEYFAPDPDGDAGTDDRPTLFGQPFDGPFGEEGAPPVYLLHAWVHRRNPAGAFAPFNPRVRC